MCRTNQEGTETSPSNEQSTDVDFRSLESCVDVVYAILDSFIPSSWLTIKAGVSVTSRSTNHPRARRNHVVVAIGSREEATPPPLRRGVLNDRSAPLFVKGGASSDSIVMLKDGTVSSVGPNDTRVEK